MTRSLTEGRALALEAELRKIASEARKDLATLGSHSLLIETALRVLMKHDLLMEFAAEMQKPPTDERDALRARVLELEQQLSAIAEPAVLFEGRSAPK